MNVSTLRERCDRASELKGRTQAFAEAVGEINKLIQGRDDLETIRLLSGLMDGLLVKLHTAAAEVTAIRVITDAELSAQGAKT